MARIDVDELRWAVKDYCGTAMMGGFTGAVVDLSEVDSLSGQQLCQKAESLGIDLNRFKLDDDDE